MKIRILFCLFSLLATVASQGDRHSRNRLTDFLRHFLPGTRGSRINCECGLSGMRTGKVVNGTDAQLQPWLAALYFENTKQQFCSASLINSRWLVTAYHCLMEQTTQSLRILLGARRIADNQVAKAIHFYSNDPMRSRDRETKRAALELLYQLGPDGNRTYLFDSNQLDSFVLDEVRIFKAKRFVLNKEFEKSFFKNDIALIELESDVKFSDAIRPICLINEAMYLDAGMDMLRRRAKNELNDQNEKDDLKTDSNDDLNDDLKFELSEKEKFAAEERWLMRQEFEAFGFGRIGFNMAGSAKLQKVTLHYEFLNRCRAQWSAKLAFYGGLIDETQICVINKYSSICHGDSGTGLVISRNSVDWPNGDLSTRPSNGKLKKYLVGLASAGYYCETSVPSLFTRLSRQLDFIYANAKTGYWCSK